MKSLKLFKPIVSVVVITFIATLFSFATYAQSGMCSERGLIAFARKHGNVYSLAPGIITKRAKYNRIDITVFKMGGRARTQVNIYLNGVRQGFLTFSNGNYTEEKTISLSNAKGKNIKVEIVNQSVGNRFEYTCILYESQKKIISKVKNKTLLPNNHYDDKALSCTKKYKFILKRKEGNARCWLKIYADERHRTLIKRVMINRNENQKIITIEKNVGTQYVSVYYQVSNSDANNYIKFDLTVERVN